MACACNSGHFNHDLKFHLRGFAESAKAPLSEHLWRIIFWMVRSPMDRCRWHTFLLKRLRVKNTGSCKALKPNLEICPRPSRYDHFYQPSGNRVLQCPSEQWFTWCMYVDHGCIFFLHKWPLETFLHSFLFTRNTCYICIQSYKTETSWNQLRLALIKGSFFCGP